MNALTRLLPPAMADGFAPRGRPLVIGLLNNSPDTAFRATERQFARALRDASAGLNLTMQCYALPEIHADPMACRAHGHVHLPVQMLRSMPPDGLIISGAEPKCDDMRKEAYWQSLTQVLAWVRLRKIPVLFSCLAAHAAVLHASGITRRRLPRKCSGVFQVTARMPHRLLHGAGDTPCTPHSRWNELPEEALLAAGYRILTHAGAAGVDMFLGPEGDDTVFLNGHPEYDSGTLMKEYRRDVARFVRTEMAAHPDLPCVPMSPHLRACFDAARALAESGRGSEALALFPAVDDPCDAVPAWRGLATSVFGGWLLQVHEHAGVG